MRAQSLVAAFAVIALLIMSDVAKAGDTTITWQVMSNGGTNSTNDDYALHGTLKQTSIRLTYGGGYADECGFWPYIRSLGPCCIGNRGNVDGDPNENVDITDVTYLNDFLFKSGAAPTCTEEADLDGSGGGNPIDITDLTYLIDYLFRSGPAPGSCP